MASVLMLATFIVVLLTTILAYLAYPAWKLRRVPAAPSVWGIGHLHVLLKHQERIFIKLAQQLGPVFRFQMGRQPIVFVANAELCREVGIKKFKSVFVRSIPPYVKTCPMFLQGIVFSGDYKAWTSMRQLVVSLFHPEKLSNYVPTMQHFMGVLRDILQSKTDDEDVDMGKLLHMLTLDIVGETVFGSGFSLLENELPHAVNTQHDDLAEAVVENIQGLTMNKQASLSIIVGMLFPILQMPVMEILKRIPGTRDWAQSNSYLKVVKKAKELFKQKKEEGGKDIVSLLLHARNEKEELAELLSDDCITAIAYELILGGGDSCANTLSMILYYVSDHPEVEQQLLQEIDMLAPAGTELCIHKFVYLDQVIKESMRTTFLSPITARETIEDVNIAGYHIPKGTWLWLALIVPTRDPEIFPDPLAFRPERFDPSNPPSGSWPFGLGPRMCPGYKFARVELKLAIISLYQHFTFVHSPLMELSSLASPSRPLMALSSVFTPA